MEGLPTTGSAAYNPFWEPYIWGVILVFALYFVADAYLVFLFFSKRILFPKLYIWIAVLDLVVGVLDTTLLKVFLPYEQIFDPETTIAFVQSLAILMIWVALLAYVRKSEGDIYKVTLTSRRSHEDSELPTNSSPSYWMYQSVWTGWNTKVYSRGI